MSLREEFSEALGKTQSTIATNRRLVREFVEALPQLAQDRLKRIGHGAWGDCSGESGPINVIQSETLWLASDAPSAPDVLKTTEEYADLLKLCASPVMDVKVEIKLMPDDCGNPRYFVVVDCVEPFSASPDAAIGKRALDRGFERPC